MEFQKPMEPISTHELQTSPDWIAQIKWDGVRVLTHFHKGMVTLFTRNGIDCTAQYPELHPISEYTDAQSIILDGEVIALDKNQRPSFYQVMKRHKLRNQTKISMAKQSNPIFYMIFDLLYLNGTSLTYEPLQKRMEFIRTWIQPTASIQIVESVNDIRSLFQVTKQHQLEGIVMKNVHSLYEWGKKSYSWQKLKHFQDLYAVVGGIVVDGTNVKSWLLGLYRNDGSFVYIGHVGTGLKIDQLHWLNLAERTKTQNSPFVNLSAYDMHTVWIQPTTVVRVQYLEWSERHMLRHGSIQAIVDIPVSKCIWDQVNT